MRCILKCKFLIILLALVVAGLVWVFWCNNKEDGRKLETFSLSNGMNVVVMPDHRSPVVLHSVWYKAGSVDEPTGKTGIAHMLEHMMFKGTQKIKPGEMSEIVARNGGQDNAFTSRDYTAYYQKVAKDKLPLMMELEADRIANLTLANKDFQPERDVVLEERRQRTDVKPINRFFEKLVHTHYPNHPYGNPIIGWREDIENYTLQDALDWYGKHYAPNNATMILAGDITAAEAKPLVEKYYGSLDVKPTPERQEYREPLRDEPVVLKHIDAEVKVPVFYRLYRAPSAFQNVGGGTERTDDAMALVMLAEIFGNSETGILYEALVKDQQIADAANADYDAVSLGEGSIDIFVQPKPDVTLRAIDAAVAAEIKKFIAAGVNADDFARAKTSLLADDVYAQDDIFHSVYRLGLWLMAGGDVKTYDDWKQELADLTPADVMAVAKRYLDINRSTTGLLAGNEAQF